mgnify:CR=1 FL=1
MSVLAARHVPVASANAAFSAAARLQIAVADKTTLRFTATIDGAAIGLAVRVLNKAAVALLGEC